MQRRILVVAVLAFTSLIASCASTGQFMPLSSNETVIGTVQASFTAQVRWFNRYLINTQAYITLLEAARNTYPQQDKTIHVDIRDIVWVSGRAVDYRNEEYSATAKVIIGK